MTRNCFVCRAEHEQCRHEEVTLVSPLVRVPVTAWLCSEECRDTLKFNVRPEVEDSRRIAAVREMLDGE